MPVAYTVKKQSKLIETNGTYKTRHYPKHIKQILQQRMIKSILTGLPYWHTHHLKREGSFQKNHFPSWTPL